MTDINYYKFAALPANLREFHTLAEIWALENTNEGVFVFSPNDVAIFGRQVPFDLYNPDSGVDFCRVFRSGDCSSFVPSTSIAFNISIKIENETILTNRITALFRAVFRTLRINAQIGNYLIKYGDKIAGIIAPPYGLDGFFISGAIIYLGYDTNLAKSALHAQNIPFEKFAGLNELGVAVTKTQIARAIETEFYNTIGKQLIAKPFATVQPELEALNNDRIVKNWVENGVY